MRHLFKSRRRLALGLLVTMAAMTFGWSGGVEAQSGRSLFILKSTAKEPDAVVAAIRAYAEDQKWQYLGDTKIKQGQITLVKICIPQVGQALWAAGSQFSAMLPCGNIGVYKSGTQTEISLLDPSYMTVLHRSPETERASAIAKPLLGALLDAITN